MSRQTRDAFARFFVAQRERMEALAADCERRGMPKAAESCRRSAAECEAAAMAAAAPDETAAPC